MHELHPSRLRLGVIGAPLLAAALLLAGCSVEPSGPPTAPEPRGALSVALRGPDLAAAIAAQERHTPGLLAIGGVVGTAVGLDQAGEPVVKVFTVQPGVRGIPSRLDGDVPVAVEVTGMFVARSDPTTRARPAPIGFSVGHPDITAGTIGARVTDGTNVYILSNNHVLANSNDAQLNDSALQPGPFDGGTDPADRVGGLHDFEEIRFDGSNNTMDAAIAITTTSNVGNSTPTDDGYGTPSSQLVSFSPIGNLLGLEVQKYGRTTGLTTGEITEVNLTVSVCYEARGPFFCVKAATFVDQIAIGPGGFSEGGDSGSLIVTNNSGKNPVGLLFAGSTTRTIANRIDLVLDRFGMTIDDGSAPPPDPDPVTDIAVTDVSAPASAATQGDVVSVDVTVENVGNQNVTTDIAVTLDDDTDNVQIGNQTITGGLAAGASTVLTFSWNTSGASPGNHTLTATQGTADDNPGNDSASTVFTVNEPGGGGISLTATGYKIRGLQKADLEWSGATSTQVDIFRNDAPLTTTANDDFHTDNIDQRGSGSYTYQVCEAGTSTCSNEATVVF